MLKKESAKQYYSEILHSVLARKRTNREQTARILEQDHIIQEKGWEDYVIFMTELVARLKQEVRWYKLYYAKSAPSFCFLRKACGIPHSGIYDLGDDFDKKETVDPKALRLLIEYPLAGRNLMQYTEIVDKMKRALSDTLSNTYLFYKTVNTVIKHRYPWDFTTMILGKEPIPDDVVKEVGEQTIEEYNGGKPDFSAYQDYFIVTLVIREGI